MERHPSGRRGEKGTLLHCGWGCKWVGVITVETGRRFLETLSIELPHDPATPLLGNDGEKTKTIIRKDPGTPVFTAALFTITMTRKELKCPLTDEWIKKVWYIHTMEYYSAIRKRNNAICSNMDATEIITHYLTYQAK